MALIWRVEQMPRAGMHFSPPNARLTCQPEQSTAIRRVTPQRVPNRLVIFKTDRTRFGWSV